MNDDDVFTILFMIGVLYVMFCVMGRVLKVETPYQWKKQHSKICHCRSCRKIFGDDQ